MICDVIYETIPEVQIHYQTKHIDQDLQSTSTNHPNHTTNTSLSPNPKSMTTNVSFFGSLHSSTDSSWEDMPDPPAPQTLTFDVPSGLKTLQQQFETTTKVVNQKPKKGNKPLASGNPKAKATFKSKGMSYFC